MGWVQMPLILHSQPVQKCPALHVRRHGSGCTDQTGCKQSHVGYLLLAQTISCPSILCCCERVRRLPALRITASPVFCAFQLTHSFGGAETVRRTLYGGHGVRKLSMGQVQAECRKIKVLDQCINFHAATATIQGMRPNRLKSKVHAGAHAQEHGRKIRTLKVHSCRRRPKHQMWAPQGFHHQGSLGN